MSKHSINFILPLTLFVIVAACNNSVEEVSRTIAPPPTQNVSATLSNDLQSVLALDGQLTVLLTVDDNSTQSMTLFGSNADIDLTAKQVPGQHRYFLEVRYIATNSFSSILLAEATKDSADARVRFTAAEWRTIPYDKDGSGAVEEPELQALDSDLDKKPNLAEVLVGGDPRNPGPTFLGSSRVKVPEKQSQSGGRYVVYTANALSPRDDVALQYSIIGGAQMNRFTIDPNNGKLSFIDNNGAINNSITWPKFTEGGNNNYIVEIQADDGTITNKITVTVTITDVFNLNVTVSVRSLNFSWFALPGAKYYKLLENVDGNSGFTDVASAGRIEILAFSQKITVFRFNPNARYMLQAYNNNDELLDTSKELSWTASLLATVGVVKAPPPYYYGPSDGFGVGISLSADGTTLAVGAPYEDNNIKTVIGGENPIPSSNCGSDTSTSCRKDYGAVYVFVRSLGDSTAWDDADFSAYIKAPNAGLSDNFGRTVSLSGDGAILAVGATGEGSIVGTDTVIIDKNLIPGNDCESDLPANCIKASGAVYIYERNGTTWSKGRFAAYIKAPNAKASDNFGSGISLSADGTTLGVGATRENSNVGTDAVVGSGTIENPIQIPGNDCGNVSSPIINCVKDSGAVYVYERNGTAWNTGRFAAYIKAPNAGVFDVFGISVSLSADGSTLAVGAAKEDNGAGTVIGAATPIANSDCSIASSTNCAVDSGAVYIYERNGTAWGKGRFAAFVKAPNAGYYERFGGNVSLSADGATLAVGVYSESSIGVDIIVIDAKAISGNDCMAALSTNCAKNSGAVYVYERNGAAWDTGRFAAYIKAPNAGDEAGFGGNVGISADGAILLIGAGRAGYVIDGADIVIFDKSLIPGNDCGTVSATNCAQNTSAIYVYDRNGTAWGTGRFASYITRSGPRINLSADGATLAVLSSVQIRGNLSIGAVKIY